jgi:hypothetical protein
VKVGKIQIYIEPRDLYIGYYRGLDNHFVCVLSTLVIYWLRKAAK